MLSLHWHSRLLLSMAVTPLGVSVALAACSASGPNTVSAEAGAGADAAVPDAHDSAVARVDAGSCKLVKPYSTKNKACNECAATECCVEVNGCLGEVECDDHYVNCILACALLPDDAGPDASAGIAACETDCGNSYRLGRDAYDRATGCADQKCAGPCGT